MINYKWKSKNDEFPIVLENVTFIYEVTVFKNILIKAE